MVNERRTSSLPLSYTDLSILPSANAFLGEHSVVIFPASVRAPNASVCDDESHLHSTILPA